MSTDTQFRVVIPSRNIDNLIPCVAAVRHNEAQLWGEHIIVVDDDETGRVGAFCQEERLTRIQGEKPFIFARNANLGLTHAFAVSDAAILLNDDAILKTRGGFSILHGMSRENPQYGILSASTNSAGNVNQYPKGNEGIRRDHCTLCFICVLITLQTWLKIGSLDERYCVDYGVEDGDYCYRARTAGRKLGIVDRCYVDHDCLVSTFRGHGGASFARNAELFRQKWGFAYESK